MRLTSDNQMSYDGIMFRRSIRFYELVATALGAAGVCLFVAQAQAWAIVAAVAALTAWAVMIWVEVQAR